VGVGLRVGIIAARPVPKLGLLTRTIAGIARQKKQVASRVVRITRVLVSRFK
jgi:hypothetical protein